ncbi:MAG TPA: LLM class flavin-dependent oxidoreductase, partial [Microbacterium sp.]|nr:LLM class flavin-dependent oxidoreductase [Microbacterium sp.]
PERTVPVLAAGEGPKTLSLTGEVADGTVLTAGSSPAMVRSAASRIHAAREAAGRTGPHEIVVFLMCAFGDTASALEAEFDAWGFSGERRFAASGDDAAVAEAIAALTDAGATSVILQPLSHDADLAPYAAATARVTAIVRAAEPPRP